MNTIPNEPTCPRCGKTVSLGAFEGLCPECLMQAGFGTVTGSLRGEKISAFIPPTPEELAKHFPQLEIIELLGRGGMGAVYKARQTHLDRIVALKILPPGVNQAPTFAERFVREAKALAKLHHPNIVTLYESGQSGELFYFLMEFVDGVNLRQLLADGAMSPKDALAIVPQICDALQFAHDRGIVHRDIKPENILLNKIGQVKIADFGVAKLVGDEPPAISSTGSITPGATQTEVGKAIGTPQYMAPEQLSHASEVDNRADIYALGVVFYQMLTGELPAGKFEKPSNKVQIDVRLDEVVLRALEKKPELRFQQASALKTQVETIAATQSVPGIPDAPPALHRSPSGSTGPSGNRILTSILRWLGVAFTIFLLTLLCGAFITYKILPKVYEATAQIQVLPVGTTDKNGFNPISDPTIFQSEFAAIESSDVLLPVITDLGLDKAWAKRVFKPGLTPLPPQDALVYMNKILHLDFVRGTNILNITASSELPKEAADIANGVAEHYVLLRRQQYDLRNKTAINSLQDQINQAQKAVDDKKASLEQLRTDLGQKGIEITLGADDQSGADLEARQKDLLAAQEDYNAKQVLLDHVIKLPDDQLLSTLAGLGRQQGDIASLHADILKIESDIPNLLRDLRQMGLVMGLHLFR